MDNWFEEGSQIEEAPVSATKYTGATIHKSTLLRELTGANYTLSNPDARIGGTEKHRLVVEYLRLRIKDFSTDEAFMAIATNEAAQNPAPPPRTTLWQKKPQKVSNDVMAEVAKVGETFIAGEKFWKDAKFERNCKAKILTPQRNPAGDLSYRIDVAVKQPSGEGTRCYDFKFTEEPFSAEIAETEIAVMELAMREGKLNENNIPIHPGCRLVFPGFIQGKEIDFSKRTKEVKTNIIETCLRLLTAAFESEDNHLNTVRHRVTKRDWKDRKPQKPADVPAWQINLF